eukprot:8524626-Heterocapsa_arctica.AAC.1
MAFRAPSFPFLLTLFLRSLFPLPARSYPLACCPVYQPRARCRHAKMKRPASDLDEQQVYLRPWATL